MANETVGARVEAALKPALDRSERMDASSNQAVSRIKRATRQVDWTQKALCAVMGALLGALIVTGAFWIRINRISDDVGVIVSQQATSQSGTNAAPAWRKR